MSIAVECCDIVEKWGKVDVRALTWSNIENVLLDDREHLIWQYMWCDSILEKNYW